MEVPAVDETKRFLFHCKPYHVDADPSQNTLAEFFDETFGAFCLLSTEFRIVMPTVLQYMLLLYFVGTSMPVVLINTSFTEYRSARAVSYKNN